MVGFHEMYRINLWKPGDKRPLMQGMWRVVSILGKMCKQGDLKALKAEIDEIRATREKPFDRPVAWVWLSSRESLWQSAYEHGHWHILEYLVQDLGFNVTPPLLVKWNLPWAVAQRAKQTNSTEELQRLLDLGWDINSRVGQSPYNTYVCEHYSTVRYVLRYFFSNGLTPFSCVCTSEPLVRWYLSNGAFPCPESMSSAARKAPLPILEMLVQHGGKVEGTDLVAHAALGDMWGLANRVAVVEYLLGMGALVDGRTRGRWPGAGDEPLIKASYDFSEHQTAYNIARISGNHELEKILVTRRADTKTCTATPEISKRTRLSSIRCNYPKFPCTCFVPIDPK